MNLYKKAIEKLKENKQAKKEGKFLGVPYPFEKLNDFLFGIEKGQSIGLLGPTGSGKSKWTRYVFLYHAFKFHKQTGYKLKILYFCMEDSKEKIYNYLFCNYLKEYCDISITIQELTSKSRELPDFVLDALHEAEKFFEDFESIVTIIDGVTEPTAIFETCKGIAEQLGKTYTYQMQVEDEIIEQKEYVSDTHVIAIFDNMSNIDTEDGVSNDQAAILKFVKEYMRLQLCNFYKFTCVMVMQLDFESERQTFTKDGNLMISKLEPSLAGVGDSKRSTRSFHLIFGLFNPSRYGILKYPIPPKNNPQAYYDIDILDNRFRSLKVLKANDTDFNMKLGLLFNGISEIFTELPAPDSAEIKKVYQEISGKPRFVKVKNQLIFKEDDTDMPF